ncbi:cytochrome b561 [Rhizobium sp. RU20A]|uniref:cytochrome b n=1 Tax=Rhizobium sp. RU20A TaxID=1907412 RepID=UPI000956CE69|nr:cytochrome b/b6 domain-containing protein [Rhizobium sp. RU20A]SIQ90763.1 cytochrome b561 [Rhizobium sp. RU20A]
MSPLRYSVPQRILHWGMALLIFFNLLFPGGMEHWNSLVRRGETVTPEDVASANIHAYVGIAILALAVVRIILRLVQGAPEPPVEEPAALRLLAKVTHGLLYVFLLAMPLGGIAAYYFGVEIAGELHGGVMKLVLWLLIVAHVAGALVHQFYWKTNVLARMTHGRVA